MNLLWYLSTNFIRKIRPLASKFPFIFFLPNPVFFFHYFQPERGGGGWTNGTQFYIIGRTSKYIHTYITLSLYNYSIIFYYYILWVNYISADTSASRRAVVVERKRKKKKHSSPSHYALMWLKQAGLKSRFSYLCPPPLCKNHNRVFFLYYSF